MKWDKLWISLIDLLKDVSHYGLWLRQVSFQVWACRYLMWSSQSEQKVRGWFKGFSTIQTFAFFRFCFFLKFLSEEKEVEIITSYGEVEGLDACLCAK